MSFRRPKEAKPQNKVPARHKIVSFLDSVGRLKVIDNYDDNLEIFNCQMHTRPDSQLIYKIKGDPMTHIIPNHRIIKFQVDVPTDYYVNELKDKK